MEEVINFVSKECVWIPATILPIVITAIIVIYKIAKICTSNAATSLKLYFANKKIKNQEKTIDNLIEQRADDLTAEKNYLIKLNELEYNKKKINLNNERIIDIDSRMKINDEIKAERQEAKKHENEIDSKKKKVRVKVVKKAVEETIAEQNEDKEIN